MENELVVEINEIREEIKDFKRQSRIDNEVKNGLLEQLNNELQIQNDLLETIASKLGIMR